MNQGPGPKSLLHRVVSLEKDRQETFRIIKQLQDQLRTITSGGGSVSQGVPNISTEYGEPSGTFSPPQEEDAVGSFSGQGNVAGSQSDFPEAVDEEDITLIDEIRFGKRREYEERGSREDEGLKRKRMRSDRVEEGPMEMTLEEQLALDM